MSVYVDSLFKWPIIGLNAQATYHARRNGDMWCHLTADSEAELDAFAARIGLKRFWKQHPGTVRVHYDLTPEKRRQAVAAGAIEEDSRDTVRRVRVKEEADHG